jgi:hypothetical protein
MPKMRPPSTNLSDRRKVLHGIHRLETRMSAMEGRLPPQNVLISNRSMVGAQGLEPWTR